MNKTIKMPMLIVCLILSLTANAYLVWVYMWYPEAQSENEYVPYRPVFFDTRKKPSIESLYMVDTSRMDDTHIKNVVFVLKYHSQAYKFNGHKLLINKTLWEDKDYLANMTNKANNKEWLMQKKQERLVRQKRLEKLDKQ